MKGEVKVKLVAAVIFTFIETTTNTFGILTALEKMENIPDWAAFEEDRLKSFKKWPFKKGPCNPEKVCLNIF